MVHEAMVLEYSGRHLALIEAAASLKLLLYMSLIACVFLPWGMAAAGRRACAPTPIGVGAYAAPSWRSAASLLAVFETVDRQDAGVPRAASSSARRLMLGLLGDAAAVRVAGPVMDAGLQFDIAHLLAGGLVLVSFMLLYQDRMFGLLNIFALHAVVLALSVAWQAYIQDAPHLYVTAAIALAVQGDRHPGGAAPDRRRLGIHRTIETVVGVGLTMLAGIGLVALSILVMLPVTADADALAREDLAFALSVVLLGLLMMITRRNAVSQVVGFMSLENGLILAATGAKGMPLVVEISVAFSVLVALHRDRHLPVPHPRALRHRRPARARHVPRRAAMNASAPSRSSRVLAVPASAAAIARAAAGLSAAARGSTSLPSALTFVAGARAVRAHARSPASFLIVDDLNIVFIALNTFVGFTTSVFSASYIAHELETGRLTPVYLRFYHAMYQTLMFAMNLALLANNIGLMWVAVELATLTTVLMVGIYRTPEALEAAWKYFILGSVGIALALFGTILVYLAAQPVIGEGLDAMAWTVLVTGPRRSIRRCSTSPSCSCCSATAPRSAWRRCTPGCPMPMPRARRRSRPCCRACCSTSRSTRCCASRC